MFLVKRDLNELKEQREALLGRAWVSASRTEQRRLIQSFCEGYILPPLAVRCPTTFRAQVNTDRKLFTNVRRLLAPPADRVRQAGRLNRAGEPTLYIAGSANAAVGEVRPSLGSMVTVLACRLDPAAPPLQVAPVAMTRLEGTPRLGPISQLHARGPLGQDWFVRILENGDCVEQWMLQDQSLGEILGMDLATDEQQALYEITNGVRDHLYRTFPDYQGVQYPSIVVERTAPNIALDATRWSAVNPLEVWVLEVTAELGLPAFGSVMDTQPLMWLGAIQPDGRIDYRATDKTFLTAVNEFKQKHGLIGPVEDYMEPTLQKPFVRSRISYGSDPSRKSIDFFP